jgi:enoyl-CoA hydratase/carnithine racemase
MTLEIALTATARTALEYRTLGLVNRVCEPGTLHAATREFVSVLNDRAPWVLRRTRALMLSPEHAPIGTGVGLATISCCVSTTRPLSSRPPHPRRARYKR